MVKKANISCTSVNSGLLHESLTLHVHPYLRPPHLFLSLWIHLKALFTCTFRWWSPSDTLIPKTRTLTGLEPEALTPLVPHDFPVFDSVFVCRARLKKGRIWASSCPKKLINITCNHKRFSMPKTNWLCCSCVCRNTAKGKSLYMLVQQKAWRDWEAWETMIRENTPSISSIGRSGKHSVRSMKSSFSFPIVVLSQLSLCDFNLKATTAQVHLPQTDGYYSFPAELDPNFKCFPPPREQKNASKLVNQIPHARTEIGRHRNEEDVGRKSHSVIQERETPRGNVGVTSHQRNLRCGLID